MATQAFKLAEVPPEPVRPACTMVRNLSMACEQAHSEAFIVEIVDCAVRALLFQADWNG
jgi:hypothetical protein